MGAERRLGSRSSSFVAAALEQHLMCTRSPVRNCPRRSIPSSCAECSSEPLQSLMFAFKMPQPLWRHTTFIDEFVLNLSSTELFAKSGSLPHSRHFSCSFADRVVVDLDSNSPDQSDTSLALQSEQTRRFRCTCFLPLTLFAPTNLCCLLRSHQILLVCVVSVEWR